MEQSPDPIQAGKARWKARLYETLRRFILLTVLAFWIGGFTFYTTVVIHAGTAVLKSHVRQGLITQQVTNWLNLTGSITLAVLLIELLTARRHYGRLWRLLAIGWLLMVLLQASLFAVHPMMDRLIDGPARAVLDEGRFNSLHDVYVFLATAQWAVAVGYTLGMLWSWTDIKQQPAIRKSVDERQSLIM